jgi:hypothetical protein
MDHSSMGYNELRARWAHRRDVLLDCGDDRAAKIVEKFLTDIDAVAKTESQPTLTLTAASRLCGYSTRQLARLIQNGTIPNVGRPQAPQVRYSDLPLKPSALRGSTTEHSLETTRGRIAQSVFNQRKG